MINSPIHSLAFIGNFGGGEIILIFLIILLLFGAKKVPELFRSLGKGVTEFRKAKNDWEQDISEVMNQDPIRIMTSKKRTIRNLKLATLFLRKVRNKLSINFLYYYA